ncbi:MAG TPA: hypothetical protein VHN74_06255 [Candidatus Angelobacter sp.]|nr:hypothetical protein [Candidatus Angelobacter sp.]
MRILISIVLAVGMASAQQTVQPAPPSANTGQEATSNEQKARVWLKQLIDALGGQAYLTLHDSYSEGRYGRFHNESMVGGAVFFRYWQWPDKERFEVTKERDIATLFVGDKVWDITYRGGKEADPKKDDNVRLAIVRRHYALERILREWINQPGTILLDEGQTLADNKLTERITIINAQNEAVSILISPDTHLPVSKRFTLRDPSSHDRDEEEEIFDNWRVVQGISTPYSTVLMHNGQIVRQQYLTTITYNQRPPDDYFSPVLIRHEPDKKEKKK